jgi:hypothetical protein
MKIRKPLVIGVLCIGLMAWFLLPSFIQYFAQREVLRLQSAGLKAKFVGLSGRRIGIAVESIEGWVPVQQGGRVGSFPVSYQIDDALVLLSAPFLRPWEIGTKFSARAYQGSISGVVVGLSSSALLDADIAKIDLSLHPQLRALGLEAGLLSGAVQRHALNPIQTVTSEYQVTAEALRVTLPAAIRDIIKISSIDQGRLVLKLTLEPSGRFNLSSCSLTSSLVKASLSGRGSVASRKSLSDFQGTARVELLGDEGAKLAQWLPLLTNQRVSASDKSFSCAIQVGPCEKFSAFDFRIGPRCGKATCGGL